MAKSSWKFLNFTNKDIYMYLYEYSLPGKNQEEQFYGDVSNNFKFNNINYMHHYKFYLGNNYISKKFSAYAINLKAKEFLKFTKPFFFRSKKKK